jgi:1-acyl-sn-glycerol-3-phosphate acyltransferase
MFARIVKILFFGLFVKPVVLILLGLNIHNRSKLPLSGPAIIAPNHNSHLDTMVLMSLFPLATIHKIRPVAAADYFLTNPFISWLSLNVIGIIPLSRRNIKSKEQLFQKCHDALDKSDILILFPEGSRGEPEQMSKLKKGIFRIISERTDTQIIPVILRGLGQALPKGEALFVPLNCDVIIGDAISVNDNAKESMEKLSTVYQELNQYCITKTSLDDNEEV